MKRSTLTRRSDKKRAADAEYAAARAAVEFRAFGRCEANTPACPLREHRGDQVHHRLRRSHGGGHDLENLLLVCAAAHTHLHSHPQEAYDNGWLVRGIR